MIGCGSPKNGTQLSIPPSIGALAVHVSKIRHLGSYNLRHPLKLYGVERKEWRADGRESYTVDEEKGGGGARRRESMAKMPYY
jgi:hypothetical protein